MSRFCNLCGSELRGQYHIYQRRTLPGDLIVCVTCERTAPRCVACQIPMPPGTTSGLCARCQAKLPKCVSCGQFITGPYYRNEDQQTYCEDCYRGSPRCDACGNPAVPGGFRLHDGRHVCPTCHQTAVYDQARGVELYRRVLDILANELAMDLSIRPGLVLVDRNQMAAEVAAAAAAGVALDAHLESIFGLYVRKGRRRVVYAETGLPQILLLQVLAHELGHAWQAENCPLLHDRFFVEGFAEWTAYRVLTTLGAVRKSALMLKRTDLYGQGLQAVLALEGQRGAAGVLDAIRGCVSLASDPTGIESE